LLYFVQWQVVGVFCAFSYFPLVIMKVTMNLNKMEPIKHKAMLLFEFKWKKIVKGEHNEIMAMDLKTILWLGY
jgi:hypothetical protein